MNSDIWWNQVLNPRRFLKEIISAVSSNEHIVVIELPERVPWYDYMFKAIYDKLDNGINDIVTVDEDIEDPGQYVFDNYVYDEVKIEYRNAMGYEAFFANNPNTGLENKVFWVRKQHTESYNKWLDFAEIYTKKLEKREQNGATIVLELLEADDLELSKDIRRLVYRERISQFDVMLFNTLVASQIKEAYEMKRYIVELADNIFGDNIETSSKCLAPRKWKDFIGNPYSVSKSMCECIELDSNMIENKIREAQIRVYYPLVERGRLEIVKKYYNEISKLLPCKCMFGEREVVYKKPEEVEVGTLNHFFGKGELQGEEKDRIIINKLYNARNKLSHLEILTVDEMYGIVSMQ